MGFPIWAMARAGVERRRRPALSARSGGPRRSSSRSALTVTFITCQYDEAWYDLGP